MDGVFARKPVFGRAPLRSRRERRPTHRAPESASPQSVEHWWRLRSRREKLAISASALVVAAGAAALLPEIAIAAAGGAVTAAAGWLVRKGLAG